MASALLSLLFLRHYSAFISRELIHRGNSRCGLLPRDDRFTSIEPSSPIDISFMSSIIIAGVSSYGVTLACTVSSYQVYPHRHLLPLHPALLRILIIYWSRFNSCPSSMRFILRWHGTAACKSKLSPLRHWGEGAGSNI